MSKPPLGSRSVGTSLPNDTTGQEWLTVTSPLLPELEAFLPMVADILERRWLTNDGAWNRRLEVELAVKLDVPEVATTTNGSTAIELMIRSMVEEGEVICPAFSFPATWGMLADNPRYKPVFVDIGDDWCLDPDAVAAAITPRTRAILGVHVYGLPCDDDRLRQVADKHGLALLYDAAHAFGVRWKGRGIARYGDLSAFSFHATKVFNTAEGGCIATAHPEHLAEPRLRRCFGIDEHGQQHLFGQNGKLDELRAAFGIANLAKLPAALERRAAVSRYYLEALGSLEIEGLRLPGALFNQPDLQINHAYFPVEVDPVDGVDRDRLKLHLREQAILARPYFAITPTTQPLYAGMVRPGSLPRTALASERVLCLPIHHAMSEADCAAVVQAVASCYGR